MFIIYQLLEGFGGTMTSERVSEIREISLIRFPSFSGCKVESWEMVEIV